MCIRDRAYVDNQLATYTWLRDRGVVFSPMVEAASGQSVPRAHNVDPADLVRQLAQRTKATGKVKLLLSARATSLVRDAATVSYTHLDVYKRQE